jgi:hypothetical protein
MRKSGLVFLAVVLCSAPAFAQVGAANNPVPTSANPETTSMSPPVRNPEPSGDASLDEVVCKTQPPPTGTRVGGTRVCKTNREWLQDEDALNRARNNEQQMENNMPGPGTGHSMGSTGH